MEDKKFLSSGDEAEYSDSYDSSNYEILNETHQLFLDMREKFYSRVKPKENQKSYLGMGLPSPIIVESQLVQASKDQLILRNDLELLIRKNIIRCFILTMSKYPSERYFMLEIDYIDQLEQLHDSTVDKFLAFLRFKNYISPTLSAKTCELNKITSSDITHLINKKVLLLNTGKGQQYLMSVPSSGNVVASISNGRQALVSYMNHQRNKICEKFNVERQNIRSSIFYAEFHCQELLGLGIFEEINIPNRPLQILLKTDPYAETKR